MKTEELGVKKLGYRKFAVVVLVIFVWVGWNILQADAMPTGGELGSRLILTFEPSFTVSVRSVLTISGIVKEIPYRNVVVLTNDGIYSWSFSSSWFAWVLDFDASLAFIGTVPRMDYAMLKVSTVLAGVYLENIFLLEYESINKDYGLGLQWVAEWDVTKEVTAKITSQFGLEENLAETLGWQFGSGYDIIPREELANLVYTTTWVEITGISLCESDLSLVGKFSKEKGFEYLAVNWTFGLAFCSLCPLELELDLRLTPAEKSLVLRPSFEFKGNCIKLYVHIDPWELEPTASTMLGTNFKGFGCTVHDLGGFTFSMITALDGALYKRRGGLDDILLRAWDYVPEPLPDEAVYYEITPYREVWSLATGNGAYFFAVDFYFEAHSGVLFDLSLITVETRFKPCCDAWTVRFGLAIGSYEPERLLVEFNLPF